MAALFSRRPAVDLGAVATARVARLGASHESAADLGAGRPETSPREPLPVDPLPFTGRGWVPDVAAWTAGVALDDDPVASPIDVAERDFSARYDEPVTPPRPVFDDDLVLPPGWLPGAVAVAGIEPPPAAVLPARVGFAAAMRGALTDRLPTSLRSGRLALAGRGVLALALVALLAATLAGWLMLRSRPTAVSAPVSTPVRISGARPSAAPAPSPSPAAVVVDVAGKVGHPGLVSLPAGSRVADAIRAAGGVLPGVSPGLLNLASRVSDGQQVLVGVAALPVASAAGPDGSANPVLDLNAATPAQLEQLPGVGPVLAQRIADWRTQHGGFASIDQLRSVSGIGDRKFAELRSKVRV